MTNRSTPKEEAIADLKTRVLNLSLHPGQPLDEAALCAHYGLSRTPMREVLQRLAGDGYIAIEANRGAFVSSMDMDTMRNFFQTAPIIYAAVARLATEHASQVQIAQLKKTQQRFQKAVRAQRDSELSSLNYQFHHQIGLMAESPYLAPSLERLLIDHTRMSHRFYRNDTHSSNGRIDKASEQHDQMIEAIEQRQSARTVELTIAHWELSRSEINKYVLPDSLSLDEVEQLVAE